MWFFFSNTVRITGFILISGQEENTSSFSQSMELTVIAYRSMDIDQQT